MSEEKIRHIPMRMCVSCRKMKPLSELIRFVKQKDGSAKLDMQKKEFGRGAYICRSGQCIAKAAKKNALSSHLKCSVPKELYICAGKLIPESM